MTVMSFLLKWRYLLLLFGGRGGEREVCRRKYQIKNIPDQIFLGNKK